jgi:DUF4097 and DUF4098 domain-containing protein YvlB
VSARKIGFLLLLLAFGATIETAWSVRGDLRIGPEGCRVMSGRFYGPSWSFEQAVERPLSGAAARVELRNAFGGVHVVAGAPGIVKVRLKKVVFQPTEEKAKSFADTIELRISGEGQPLRIGTNRDELDRNRQVGFETHFEIEAPADTVLSVRNEHGRVEVSGVAAAEIESSFDGVAIENVAGDVKLDSRHGDVSVKDVVGALDLTSKHGSVEVSDVKGAVKVDVQHGDLTARHTGGLQVTQQFGGVTAEGVAGDLVVRAGHSEVHASDVAAKADVETSFGAARLARIGGSARAKVDHGAVSAEDVTGGLSVESSYDGVEVARLGGPLDVSVHHGSVDAKGIAQGARVRGSGGDVEIDGATGPLDIELQRGSARIRPRAAIAAPVTLSVRNGEARLAIPEGSRVDVETESLRGEVRADVPGLSASAEHRGHRGERLSGRIAGGGSVVKVSADGDVTLESGTAAAITEQPIAKPALAAIAPAEAPAAGRPKPEAGPLPEATSAVPKAPEPPKPPATPKP